MLESSRPTPPGPRQFSQREEAATIPGTHEAEPAVTLSKETLKLALGYIGSIGLFFAVFTPFIRVPGLGSVHYFRNGEGDGVIIVVLAGLSLIFVLMRLYIALWFTGLGALGIIGFTFLDFQLRLQEMKDEMAADLEGNPFAGLGEAFAQSVSIDWGFPLLIICAGMVIAAAAIPLPSGQRLRSTRRTTLGNIL